MFFRLLLMTIVLPALTGCGFRTYYVPSGSMLPTFRPGSMLLVDYWSYKMQAPQRGDIAVFKPPIPSPDAFVKRVIALPGDAFSVRRGVVFLNGTALHETYISEPASYELRLHDDRIEVREPGSGYVPLDPALAQVPPRAAWSAPGRLPADCYLVFGDNRNDSEDAHTFGCVKRSAFLGKVIKVFR